MALRLPQRHDHEQKSRLGTVGCVDAEVRRRGHGRIGFTSLVLRSLKQAHYTPRNLGHFGLRSSHYCHFTSPIRRYPDLICHRSLLNAIGAGEATVRASDLERAGEWCSVRERDAMSIERAGDDIARCFVLERELAERGWHTEWPGEVAGVIGAGAFVAFGEGHEGLLPVRRLRGDWWELNALETMLIGSQSGKAIRLGDPVTVQVGRIDAPRGRVLESAVRAPAALAPRRSGWPTCRSACTSSTPSFPAPRARCPSSASGRSNGR